MEVIKREPTWQDGEDSFGDCEECQRFALLGQLGWTVVGVVGSGQDGDEHGDSAVPVQQAQNQEYATDHDEPVSIETVALHCNTVDQGLPNHRCTWFENPGRGFIRFLPDFCGEGI